MVFDWSGVLADDFEYSYHGVRSIVEEHGQTLSREEYKKEYQLPYEKFYKGRGINHSPDVLMKKYLAHVSKTENTVKPAAGAKEALVALKKLGFGLAILSSCAHVSRDLKDFGFDGLFDHVFEDRHDKDEGMRLLLEESGWKAGETAFVGDTEYDVLVAKKHGIAAVAFADGYRPREALEKVKPHAVVASFGELLELL